MFKVAGFFLLLLVFCWNGCALLTVGELDNALPQGKGVLRIGAGFDAPLNFGVDSIGTRKHLLVGDKSLKTLFSGKALLRYGLSEDTDVTATIWYGTSPLYGFRGTFKKAYPISPSFQAAYYASLQHFFTVNEIPYWEYAEQKYNRRSTGLTVGGVGSFLLADPEGALTQNTLSIGAKLSINKAMIHVETVYHPYPFFPGPIPPPKTDTDSFFYTVTTPYVSLSLGSQQGFTFYADLQMPIAIYEKMEIGYPLYGHLSMGLMFRLFKVTQE